MTDRELLELAAKAAGISVVWSELAECHFLACDSLQHWNPLTDDGDALRLAAALHLMINITPIETHAYYQKGLADGVATDVCSRRAIVRAAAEIGKAMS